MIMMQMRRRMVMVMVMADVQTLMQRSACALESNHSYKNLQKNERTHCLGPSPWPLVQTTTCFQSQTHIPSSFNTNSTSLTLLHFISHLVLLLLLCPSVPTVHLSLSSRAFVRTEETLDLRRGQTRTTHLTLTLSKQHATSSYLTFLRSYFALI